MNARTPLIAGNWKMNMDHLQATHLIQKVAWGLTDAKHDFAAVEVAVFPPFTDLRTAQTLVDGEQLKLAYGAQDVSVHAEGAYTGEVSARMLAKLGCKYVIVGHSERRQYHGESDEVVNAKVKAALGQEIAPIVCIGEGADDRNAGRYIDVVTGQLSGSLAGLTAEDMASVVVAYEPVWAIGTGAVATPDDAQEVCAAIRIKLAEHFGDDVAAATRVLYGGSVKGSNAAGLMGCDDIDGALVGGAALDADEFVTICRFREHAYTA